MAGLWSGSTGVGVSKTSRGDGSSTYDPFGTASKGKDQSRMQMSDLPDASQIASKPSSTTTTASKSTPDPKGSSSKGGSTEVAKTAAPATPFSSAFSLVSGLPSPQSKPAIDAVEAMAAGKKAAESDFPALPPVPAYVEEEPVASRGVGAVNASSKASEPSAVATARGGLAPSPSLSMTGNAMQSPATSMGLATAPTNMQQQINDAFSAASGNQYGTGYAGYAAMDQMARDSRYDATKATVEAMRSADDTKSQRAQTSSWDALGNPTQYGGNPQTMEISTREQALTGSAPNVTAGTTQPAAMQTTAQPAVSAFGPDGTALGIGPAASQTMSTREAALAGTMPGGFGGLAPAAAPAPSTKSTEKTTGKAGATSKASTAAPTSARTATPAPAASTTTQTQSSSSSEGKSGSPGYGDSVTLASGGKGTYASPGLAIDSNGNYVGYSPSGSQGSGQQSGGGCYITTAAMLGAEADDGPTLTALRRFRDAIMAPRDDWRADIATYYATAPAIVQRIDASVRREKIYGIIRRRVLAPCVRMIEEGKYDSAHRLYRRMVSFLTRADLGD